MGQEIDSMMTGLANSLNQYMGLSIQSQLEDKKASRKLASDMTLKNYESELDLNKGKNLELFKTQLEDAKKRGQSVKLGDLKDIPEFASLSGVAPEALLDAKDLIHYMTEQKKATKEGAPKEFQFKAGNYYKMAQSGENTLQDLSKKIDLGTWAPVGRSEYTPEILRGEDWKQFMAARKGIAEAYLRPATGATINATEYESVDKIFMPLPGDSPKVLAGKEANRKGLRAALKAEADGKQVDLTVFKPVVADGEAQGGSDTGSGGWSMRPVGK